MAQEPNLDQTISIVRSFANDLEHFELEIPAFEVSTERLERILEKINNSVETAGVSLRLAAEMPSALMIDGAKSDLDNLSSLFDDYLQMRSGTLSDSEDKLYHIIDAGGEFLSKLDEWFRANYNIENLSHTEKPDLPPTKPAPIQVEIDEHVLRLIDKQTRTGPINYQSANRARESLHSVLEDVVEDLRSNSNADRGYVRLCERLLACLATPVEDLNIEHLGLTCQLLEQSTRKRVDELGDILVEQIEHVISNVTVLLSQFDDWQKFLDEQARTKLGPEDGEGLVMQGRALIAELEKPGAPVEPALIDRLKAMIEPVVTGVVSADAVAISLICSYSNIFSTLSQFAINHQEALLSTASHVVVAGKVALLLKFSVDLIEKFSPEMAKYQPLKFIIRVVKYLSSLYSQIKDASS